MDVGVPLEQQGLAFAAPDAALGDDTTTQLIAAISLLRTLAFPVEVPVAGLFAGAPDSTV